MQICDCMQIADNKPLRSEINESIYIGNKYNRNTTLKYTKQDVIFNNGFYFEWRMPYDHVDIDGNNYAHNCSS